MPASGRSRRAWGWHRLADEWAARVVAVELDSRRAGVLRERFPGITVVHADAASIRLPGRPFRVVASPPYGISSGLLRTLLAPASRLATNVKLAGAVGRHLTSRRRLARGVVQHPDEPARGMLAPATRMGTTRILRVKAASISRRTKSEYRAAKGPGEPAPAQSP